MPATAMPRLTGARSSGGRPARNVARASSARLCSSSGAGGSEWMWRSLMRTTPAGSETWKPAVRPRPTMNSVEPPPMSITTVGSVGARTAGHRAEERELRLFVAAEHARVEPVVLAHARGERGAVGGVAHGRGEHGEVRLAVVGVDLRRGSRRACASTRAMASSESEPRGVDAVAQARDLGAPEQLLDARRSSGSTSAISSRVELVPMSTTATRTAGEMLERVAA